MIILPDYHRRIGINHLLNHDHTLGDVTNNNTSNNGMVKVAMETEVETAGDRTQVITATIKAQGILAVELVTRIIMVAMVAMAILLAAPMEMLKSMVNHTITVMVTIALGIAQTLSRAVAMTTKESKAVYTGMALLATSMDGILRLLRRHHRLRYNRRHNRHGLGLIRVAISGHLRM